MVRGSSAASVPTDQRRRESSRDGENAHKEKRTDTRQVIRNSMKKSFFCNKAQLKIGMREDADALNDLNNRR
jgi:hypothetical protein